MRMFPLLTLISFFTLAKAVPQATSSGNCVGTISSLSDVSAAVQCTTVNINTFTVPAGKTFSLNLLQGTIVNVCE
jgi:polygalacturonase